MTFFSACQVIHTLCEQNQPLKRSLNLFWRKEFFKHVIEGKVDMKLSDKAREKKNFKAKIIWTLFSSLNCVLASVGVPLSYRMSLQGIGRLRKVTVYVFRQVHV